jgi:hypothetical protein
MIGSACALAMVANRKVTIAKSRSSFCRDICMTIVNPPDGMRRWRKDSKDAPKTCYAPASVAVNAILLTARLKTIIVT